MMLQVIIYLVLKLMMVKVVWVLGPLNFPPVNISVSLVVVIFCRPRVGIIHKHFIKRNTGSLTHYLRSGMKTFLLLLVLKLLLVIVPPTYPNRNNIVVDSGSMEGLFHINLIVQHPPWHHNLVSII